MACSRPFYDLLARAVHDPNALWDWVFCPYVMTALGWTGVGLIILATGFVGLKNWTESWVVPMVWTVMVAPVLATTLLPGAVLRRIAGLVTIAVAMLFIGFWYWWSRS